MVVKEGYDLQEVKVAWAEHCRYQTVMNQLTVTVSSVERRELLIDWHTDPESIGQNMAQLKKRPEYAGILSVIDLHEGERTSAFQEEMRQRQEKRKQGQDQEEAAEHLALLQPPVCSLEGIFRAAELGDLPGLDALVKGYPMPVYDHHTGTAKPNPNRLALPEDRHTIRVANQRAHTTSFLQHRHAESHAVGDPMDDLKLSAPHLFRGHGANGAIATSFDLRDTFGKTPLHIATAAGKVEMMKKLLDLGADPNAEDREGIGCIQLAAMRGDIAATKVLLERGADVTARSGDGRAIVHFAAASGSDVYMDWLLFSAETKTAQNWLMLGEKAQDGSSVLHALARADASTKDRQYAINALAKKIFRGWLGIMERAPEELLNAVDDTGSSVLHICAKADSFELLRYLTSLGADPNLQARNGDSAMHVAVRKQRIESINFLASAGSDSSIANEDGDTPLHIAAACPDKAVFKLCMQSLPPKAKPPVHARLNGAGLTPLHIAARRCSEVDLKGNAVFHEMVQYAVLNRADPAQPNGDGATPLMSAAQGGNPTTVSFLCRFTMDENGGNAAMQAKNSYGENAFIVAARAGQVAALEALVAAGIDVHCVSLTRTSAVSEAAAAGHADALRFLLSLGLDAGQKDLLGRSPLHWAAKAGHARVCEMLVEEFSVDVDEPDRGLATPLLAAVTSQRLEAVRTLVGLGADPERAARDKSTPLLECSSAAIREVLDEGVRWQSSGRGGAKLFVRRELAEAEEAAGLLLASALEAGVRAVVEPEQGEGWRKGRRRSSIAARGRLPSFDGRASRSGSQHSRSSSGHGDAAILAQLQAQCASDTEAAAASEALARAASSASLHATSRPPSSLAAHALSAHASLSNKDGAHRPLVPLAGEYQRLPPVHRPRIESALAPGSALHAQVLRREQRDAYPRPFPLPASTATSAADAFVEALGLDGPLQGVDLAWASMHKSPLWLAEHKPTRDLAAQRQHTLYLQALQRAHNELVVPKDRRAAPRKGLDPLLQTDLDQQQQQDGKEGLRRSSSGVLLPAIGSASVRGESERAESARRLSGGQGLGVSARRLA